MGLHLRSRRLQSGATAEAHGGASMTAPSHATPNCSTAAQSRSHSPITTAIKPSPKPDGTLLQQPARWSASQFSLEAPHLTSSEELHPELVPYVGRNQFGRYINSPLVEVRHLDIPFPDGFDDCSSWVEWSNRRFVEKRDMLVAAINERDWHTYIFAHERPYRFDAIRALIKANHTAIDDLWPVVADAWSDSENIHQ